MILCLSGEDISTDYCLFHLLHPGYGNMYHASADIIPYFPSLQQPYIYFLYLFFSFQIIFTCQNSWATTTEFGQNISQSGACRLQECFFKHALVLYYTTIFLNFQPVLPEIFSAFSSFPEAREKNRKA